MEFFRRAPGSPEAVAVLSGTFNPPTVAHLGLASAALSVAEEVLFVLPRQFPHKPYEGPDFDARIEMLLKATEGEPRFSVASTEKGLFIDIARECHAVYGSHARLMFLCGTDAAQRIVEWDYGHPGAIVEQLNAYELLVAERGWRYNPPPGLRSAIHSLPLPQDFSFVSATEVRERIRAGGDWRSLVPVSIHVLVERNYRPARRLST